MSNTINWGKIQGLSYSPETNLTGTAAAPSFTNTKSILLDGVDDYVDCGIISAIPSANTLSISFWANTNSITQNQVVWGDNSSTPIFSFEYWGSADRMYFEYGTGKYAFLTLTSVVSASNWNHIALVYNGLGSSNTDKIKIYVDGIDKSSIMTYVGTIPSSLSSSIGNFWIGNGQKYNVPFNGNIDEVAIFNSELSASDVTAIYGSGVPTSLSSYSSLISWWRCGDGDTAPTLTDNGSGGNNGTMTNFTTFSTDVPT